MAGPSKCCVCSQQLQWKAGLLYIRMAQLKVEVDKKGQLVGRVTKQVVICRGCMEAVSGLGPFRSTSN